MNDEDVDIDCLKFAVAERACCVWGAALSDHNLRYLGGLNAGFFRELARVHDVPASGDSSHDSAVALRISYGLGLESLFAFIGAAVQAPWCVFGWLDAYKNDELRHVVESIGEGKLKYAARPFRPATWRSISRVVHAPLVAEDKARGAEAEEQFAAWWERLAREFLSVDTSEEYNALKHGFRTMPGGFTLRVEREGQSLLEMPVPTAHTYFSLERIADKQPHYWVRQHSAALHGPRMQAALVVISQSMNNIARYLRWVQGDRQGALQYQTANGWERLERAWSDGPGVCRTSHGGKFVPNAEYRWTPEQILDVYDDVDDAT